MEWLAYSFYRELGCSARPGIRPSLALYLHLSSYSYLPRWPSTRILTRANPYFVPKIVEATNAFFRISDVSNSGSSTSFRTLQAAIKSLLIHVRKRSKKI